MSIFNSLASMIIHEGGKSDCTDCLDKDEICCDFVDTLSGLDTAEMTYTIDSLPILQDECGSRFSECNESYLIEYDIMTKFMESYGITDEIEAHSRLCEHYGFDKEQLSVVIECDAVNKGLIDKAVKTKSYGLLKDYHYTLQNLINCGIRVVKKS